MLLCFGGDMALMFMDRSKKAFRVGLGLFLLGHVAYIVALTALNGFRSAEWTSGLALAAAAALVYAWLLGVGALLFYVSDVILALHRFRYSWKYGRINLAFYYAGQALIALSASFFA